MQCPHIDQLDALRQALGQPTPPKEIRQRPLDYNPAHLHQLARLKPNERARELDLIAYADDLRNMPVQKDLLVYVLPFWLKAWREDLRGENADYIVFRERFYPAMIGGKILENVLAPKEAAAVSSFMRAAILEEIDEQRGLWFRGMESRPYRWVGALMTYGVLLPDLERLWTDWWSRNTLGASTAFIQWISCLVYSERDNPVFTPWTPDVGGGPPRLWEFEGLFFPDGWLAPNVAFLQSTLNVASVVAALRRAAARLSGYPEHEMAVRVLADASERTARLESRCQELPRILEQRQEPSASTEWSR